MIDADALTESMKWSCEQNCQKCIYQTFLSSDIHCGLIDEQPTIEAVPVVYGVNLREEYPSLFECSVCHWCCEDTVPCDTEIFNFCPNCGARIVYRGLLFALTEDKTNNDEG